MKKERHALILELIRTVKTETQEQLRELLADRGMTVTQATLSRDISELGLIKQGDRYLLPEKRDIALPPLLAGSVIGLDYAVNTVVFRCKAGMAMAVCAAFDGMHYKNVVGTLAGDDTIFVLMRSEKDAAAFVKDFGTIIFSEKGDE